MKTAIDVFFGILLFDAFFVGLVILLYYFGPTEALKSKHGYFQDVVKKYHGSINNVSARYVGGVAHEIYEVEALKTKAFLRSLGSFEALSLTRKEVEKNQKFFFYISGGLFFFLLSYKTLQDKPKIDFCLATPDRDGKLKIEMLERYELKNNHEKIMLVVQPTTKRWPSVCYS